MTGPIKPPGAPKVGGPTGPEAGETKRNPESAEAFRAELHATPDASNVSSAQSVSETVAADLQAGRLDLQGAVDRLVEDALASPMAANLTPEGRRDLETHLRDSLADDPSLAALVSDLDPERG